MRNQPFFSFHNIYDSQRKRATSEACICISLPLTLSMTMRWAKREHTFILRARAGDNSSVTVEWMGTGRCAILLSLELQVCSLTTWADSIDVFFYSLSIFYTTKKRSCHISTIIKAGTTNPMTRNFLRQPIRLLRGFCRWITLVLFVMKHVSCLFFF